jgi:hypothetical protein
VRKHKVILYRAAADDHIISICQLVIDCDTASTDDLIYALRNACCYGHLSVVQLIVITLGHH